MKKPVVVCGIDTGVGKSVVTGLLARHLMDQGRVVITRKPVQTGCKDRPEDILLHRKIMGTGWLPPDEQGLTCSYCFPLPASPHLAAERAGVEIDPARLDAATDTLAGQVDQLIIEAAGGLLVHPELLQKQEGTAQQPTSAAKQEPINIPEEYREAYELLAKKMKLLREQRSVETDAAKKFQLDTRSQRRKRIWSNSWNGKKINEHQEQIQKLTSEQTIIIEKSIRKREGFGGE